MKKLNKTQKQIIKKKIIKGVNILCYILSVLFVILMVVVGVQSCQQKPQSVSAEEDSQVLRRTNVNRLASFNDVNDYPYIYTFKYPGYTGDNTITLNNNDLSFEFDISLTNYYNYDSPDKDFEIDLSDSRLLNGSNYNFYYLNKMIFSYRVYQVYGQGGSINYQYRLRRVAMAISTDNISFGNDWFITKHDSDNALPVYNTTNSVKLYLSDEVDSKAISYFFEVSPVSSFIFNKNFNYNAPLGVSIQSGYGSSSFDSAGENMRYKNYNVGYFISNGKLYNQIQYWAIQSAGNTIIGNYNGNTNSLISAPSGYWIYSFMYYRNTDTNDEILVNYHDKLPTSSGNSTTLYYANSSTWVNDAFREITFLSQLSDDMKISINAFNNNNQNQVNGFVGSGDVTNVFTLVGSAFTGLLPILSMYILPGITIGMLMFVPLVAMLVFAIIRVIKK